MKDVGLDMLGLKVFAILNCIFIRHVLYLIFQKCFNSLMSILLITDKWQSQASNDAICPYDIVPGKGHYWDLTGSCAKMLSSSPNKLEGGECDDDIEDFICQKAKEVTSVQLNGNGKLF